MTLCHLQWRCLRTPSMAITDFSDDTNRCSAKVPLPTTMALLWHQDRSTELLTSTSVESQQITPIKVMYWAVNQTVKHSAQHGCQSNGWPLANPVARPRDCSPTVTIKCSKQSFFTQETIDFWRQVHPPSTTVNFLDIKSKWMTFGADFEMAKILKPTPDFEGRNDRLLMSNEVKRSNTCSIWPA